MSMQFRLPSPTVASRLKKRMASSIRVGPTTKTIRGKFLRQRRTWSTQVAAFLDGISDSG